jgi:hypothetical protein
MGSWGKGRAGRLGRMDGALARKKVFLLLVGWAGLEKVGLLGWGLGGGGERGGLGNVGRVGGAGWGGWGLKATSSLTHC